MKLLSGSRKIIFYKNKNALSKAKEKSTSKLILLLHRSNGNIILFYVIIFLKNLMIRMKKKNTVSFLCNMGILDKLTMIKISHNTTRTIFDVGALRSTSWRPEFLAWISSNGNIGGQPDLHRHDLFLNNSWCDGHMILKLTYLFRMKTSTFNMAGIDELDDCDAVWNERQVQFCGRI